MTRWQKSLSSLTSIVFRDAETRLLIPNRIPQIMVNNIFSKINQFADEGRLGNATVDNAKAIAESLFDLPFLLVGVTDISYHKENVIPRSKGIGSIGEVLHFIGSRNEDINVDFVTDEYPGFLGWFLKTIIYDALNYSDIIYIIDEMSLILPCVIEEANLRKTGDYEGVVHGSMALIALAENNFSTVFKTVTNLKNSVRSLTGGIGTSAVLAGGLTGSLATVARDLTR